MMAQRVSKRPYRMNIAELHALCDANYARLLRLFPDYENSNTRHFQLGVARVVIEVLERSRYTTIFRIRQHQHQYQALWLGDLTIDVRAYHDAGMLEVGAFQSRYRIAARYPYPNKQMLQEDEKLRQNQFLADWLEHSLHHGRAAPESVPDICQSRS